MVSHMAYYRDTDHPYVSGCGESLNAVPDAIRPVGGTLRLNYDGCLPREVRMSPVVDGKEVPGMELPFRMGLYDRPVALSDADTSVIFASEFDGTLVDYLGIGFPAGKLEGMRFDEDGDVWVDEQLGDRALESMPL